LGDPRGRRCQHDERSVNPSAIRRLSEVRITDVGEVGGKAAGLGELLQAGAHVPDGVVLTTEAADMTAVERQPLLQAAANDLGGRRFAVRSSGVAEDAFEHSYAGMYETVLDVPVEELSAAMEHVLASARSARTAEYEPATTSGMAVIIQRMVAPAAGGVVLTTDPINGDRHTCVVTAVRGTGDRLVSGAALGDEWHVRDDAATARRRPEQAIDRRQAIQVASEARRIAAARGAPLDIEWAIDADGTLWILQARPMTALPPDVSWEPPAPGAYTRAFRFGEWISEPVTPLFESSLLTAMEDRLHVLLEELLGERDPRPYHVVVNGWYYYSINWLSARVFARNLPGMFWHLIRHPRRVAGLFPATVRHSVPPLERDWREDLLPRYRAAVMAAEERVETLPVTELPPLIDGLADLAGEYFTSIAALAGGAFKIEINLASFYRRHLASTLGGSHLPLVAGFELPADAGRHAVVSLDWWHAPLPPADSAATPGGRHASVVEARQAAEKAAFHALASAPRRLRSFRKLLADSQHLASVREEQVPHLTLAWPVMRRAALRIGESLAAREVIPEPDDVFFLTRDEALEALGQERVAAAVDVMVRRAKWGEQAKLVAPLMVGRMTRMMQSLWERLPRLVGALPSDNALVSGTPASAGRAAGAVRVIRGPDEFDELQSGEILVAPLTAPAWTPLFNRAAGVVTDVGSLASHASIIAREYGIPAVVGCGDATARLRTGMLVTVDGSTGNVERAERQL
jgi:pyruvate,water dikinase